eukprot:7313124-Pyramimonas_sp.AAC.1
MHGYTALSTHNNSRRIRQAKVMWPTSTSSISLEQQPRRSTVSSAARSRHKLRRLTESQRP